MHSMRLSSMKAAHAALSLPRVQEIRARGRTLRGRKNPGIIDPVTVVLMGRRPLKKCFRVHVSAGGQWSSIVSIWSVHA
jgi:hypothetical protein